MRTSATNEFRSPKPRAARLKFAVGLGAPAVVLVASTLAIHGVGAVEYAAAPAVAGTSPPGSGGSAERQSRGPHTQATEIRATQVGAIGDRGALNSSGEHGLRERSVAAMPLAFMVPSERATSQRPRPQAPGVARRTGRVLSAQAVENGARTTSGFSASPMVPGEPCDCDSDCVPALPCRVGRCRKDTAGQLQAGTCEELIAPVDTRCDLDGQFCTDDRCIVSPVGASQCVNGTNNGNTCTTAGDCPGGTCEVITVCTNDAITRCAKECNGGTNIGDDCLRDADCGGGSCVLQSLPGQAVCNESLDRCEVRQGGTAIGRCCSPDGTTCSYVIESSCTSGGGKWLLMEDPDDLLDECVCPKYGSAISPAGTYGTTLGPIRISEKVCALGGDICEDATYCQKRCTGAAPFEICTVDTDCPSGQTCQPDTCVVASPARCTDGYTRIGDDYVVPNFSYLRLRQFRFRGGVDKRDEVLIFEFYERQGHCSNASATTCDSFVLSSCPGGSCVPDLVDAVSVRFADSGVYDYLIDVDCVYDCQIDEDEAPQDEPLIIPPAGWVAIRSSRVEPSADARNAANGRWASAAAEGGNEVDFGTNNPGMMWVNAAPTASGPVSPQIMVFELLGDKIPSSGACCDATNGNCTDTQKWDCRTCSATGAPCRYYPEPLRDFINCGFNDFCVEDNWFGPKSHVDFDNSGGLDCADSPCDLGACCFPNGTCQRLDQQLCTGDFQGFGTDCTPNCCTQTFTGGDCCETLFYCDDGSGDCVTGSGPCSDNTGTCQTCTGPTTHYITVPPLFDPAIAIDISGDNTPAVFTQALGDTCTLSGSDPGWYEKFHINTCGVVTVDVCCTTPLMSPVWGVLVEACPNCGRVISADQNQNGAQSGFGAGCNNSHCCPDGNFSAQFTLPAGTYLYQPYGDPTCEGSLTSCITNDDCPLGSVCEQTVGPYTVHITVDPCNPAACCMGGSCQVFNRVDCEAGGGFWLGATDPPVGDCFPPPNGVCGTGSCCMGPGVCNDTIFFDTGAECLNANPNNIFVGGAQCLRDDPCPICTFDDDAHCKSFINANVRYISPSDRALDPPIRWADDFTPQGSLLDAVCWWPAYFDPFNGAECAAAPPPDDWRVRVYEDDFGLPGLELGPPGGQTINVLAKRRIRGLRVWEYTGAFQTPLAVTPGSCLWVEITGFGEGTGCTTYLTESVGDGNGYGVQDGDGTYGPEDIIIYNEGTIDDIGDYSFCISTGLGTDNDCGPVIGPCCVCATGCSIMTATACRDAEGYFFAGESSCASVTCSTTPANNACGSATTVCGGQESCTVLVDNRCATNDGLVTTCNPVTGTGPDNDFVQDVWFHYTPPCSGKMQIDTCSDATWHDTMIAVYGGTTAACSCPPPGTDAGLITRPNPAPPPPTLPACDDNHGSEAAGTSCPPNSFGRSRLTIDATAGNCYLIRVGGDRGSNVLKEGVAELSINVTCNPLFDEACCLPSGTCTDTDAATCQGMGGSPRGAGTNCSQSYICGCQCTGDIVGPPQGNCYSPPNGMANFSDLFVAIRCFQGDAVTWCDGINRCDVNCDGLINACDYQTVLCRLQGVPDCCGSACGACCSDGTVCAETHQSKCEAAPPSGLGGVFLGRGTSCPVQNGFVFDEPGGTVFTHVIGPPVDCLNPAPSRRTPRGCNPNGPFTDAWVSHERAAMCHNFGSSDTDPIPAGFFGSGSDVYTGTVCLQGAALGMPEFGDADTLISRDLDPFDPCELPSATPRTVNLAVSDLSLSSTQPITVTYNGGQNPQTWNVTVDASPAGPLPGTPQSTLTARKTHCNGGKYTSQLYVQPRFTFRRVANPNDVRVLDTAAAGTEAVLLSQQAEASWVAALESDLNAFVDLCSDFHPGITSLVEETLCDCNGNSINDRCEIASGVIADCNKNYVSDTCDISSGRSLDADGNGVPDECKLKNRYVTFVPNSGTTSVAYQLKKESSPSFVGWIGAPDAQGIALVVTSPVYRVWAEPQVHVGDCEIVPDARYGIRATPDGIVFLSTIAVRTIHRPSPKFWGDTVGSFQGGAWTEPNGVTNVNDFLAALQKFQNPSISLHVTWVDVVGAGLPGQEACLNRSGNISDVFNLIKAFQGQAYPFTNDPGSCPVCP